MAVLLGIQASGIALAATVEVKMTDTPPVYIPKQVTIHVGDTVKWVNTAQTLHTVTFDPAKAVNKANVQLPAGVAPFDSGFMMPGQDFSHTFTVPGEYKYFCIPHEKDGMIGFVTVKK
ncbi:MAG TPA: plastocyanin/azurin family copper-binding protein [Candidatus Binataceae bacterium]|nr:plastocyanin/azurin family copper-binding protein [Candidatus Binataceae bacterium]